MILAIIRGSKVGATTLTMVLGFDRILKLKNFASNKNNLTTTFFFNFSGEKNVNEAVWGFFFQHTQKNLKLNLVLEVALILESNIYGNKKTHTSTKVSSGVGDSNSRIRTLSTKRC